MELISSSIFSNWLAKLKDRDAKRRIMLTLTRCEAHGKMVGDIKPVGGGVYEMRLFFGAGYRVYYTQIGSLTVFLLAGGDKSSQTKDIRVAQQLAQELKGKHHD